MLFLEVGNQRLLIAQLQMVSPDDIGRIVYKERRQRKSEYPLGRSSLTSPEPSSNRIDDNLDRTISVAPMMDWTQLSQNSSTIKRLAPSKKFCLQYVSFKSGNFLRAAHQRRLRVCDLRTPSVMRS